MLKREFFSYLERKNMIRWVHSFYKQINDIDITEIFNEDNLPTIHSSHSILREFSIPPEENNENLRKIQNEEIDIYDQQLYMRLHDIRPNFQLIEDLKKYL